MTDDDRRTVSDGGLAGVRWRKSSFSQQGECVEVGADPVAAPDVVFVRDTKDRTGGTIAVSGSAWRAFLDQL